jgi:hypothetical protein
MVKVSSQELILWERGTAQPQSPRKLQEYLDFLESCYWLTKSTGPPTGTCRLCFGSRYLGTTESPVECPRCHGSGNESDEPELPPNLES